MPVDNYGMHKSHAEHSAVKFRLPLLYLDMEGGRAGMGKENWKEG
jgi:hypothetical protein